MQMTPLYSSLDKSGLWHSMPPKRKCFLSIAIDPLLMPVEMYGIELPEETSFCLLGLTFTRSMEWEP